MTGQLRPDSRWPGWPKPIRPTVLSYSAGLGPIPLSLGPEDADRRHGNERESRGRAWRRRALEREIAHLAFDGAGIVARAAGRESLGADLGQQVG